MKRLTLTLDCRVISKKNSKRVMRSKTTRKSVVLPSVAYQRFRDEAVMLLRSQINRAGAGHALPFTGQVRVDTHFHIKGKYNVDADNLHTSILDVLQDAGVIENDSLVVEGGYTKSGNAQDWYTLIHVTALE